MLRIKIVSSLEKPFREDCFEDFRALNRLSALKNERISFQVIASIGNTESFSEQYSVSFDGALAKYATVREVISVPVTLPTFPDNYDDNYIKLTPGLYPDLLIPLRYADMLRVNKYFLSALWIELDLREETDVPIGTIPLTVTLSNENESASEKIVLDIIDASLPEQKLIFTEWFHSDCLANYYRTPVFSEEFWNIVENFALTARKNGINMLLTPTFTPPLDTAIGGERLTVQLVDVTKSENNYIFGFDKLDRWIEMCDRVGIKYFEISHFFTQWGALHAPKIMASVNGKYKKIFGWETDATSPEYTHFLRSFVKAFLEHMEARGDDKRCYFHISDEPKADQLDSYKSAKESVSDLLSDYPIMDALSNYEFYSNGLVDMPIPSTNHIEPFLEHRSPNLWTYYCCGQWEGVSNRFIAMPAARNRSIGMQMFKYDIVGFLHWGYNFYNTQHSYAPIDPYRDTSGDGWVPAGDTFSVYPAPDGSAYESTRIVVFYEALQDARAMKLASTLCGKDKVVKVIEEAFGKPVQFSDCARTSDEILRVREAVNKLIKDNI